MTEEDIVGAPYPPDWWPDDWKGKNRALNDLQVSLNRTPSLKGKLWIMMEAISDLQRRLDQVQGYDD